MWDGCISTSHRVQYICHPTLHMGLAHDVPGEAVVLRATCKDLNNVSRPARGACAACSSVGKRGPFTGLVHQETGKLERCGIAASIFGIEMGQGVRPACALPKKGTRAQGSGAMTGCGRSLSTCFAGTKALHVQACGQVTPCAPSLCCCRAIKCE